MQILSLQVYMQIEKQLLITRRSGAKQPLKVKSDHRSKFSNLSYLKEEDLLDTGAMLYQLSYEATHWE